MRIKTVGRPKKEIKKTRLNISIDPAILEQAKKFFGKRKLSQKIENFLKSNLK